MYVALMQRAHLISQIYVTDSQGIVTADSGESPIGPVTHTDPKIRVRQHKVSHSQHLIPDPESIFILYLVRARTLHESLTGSEPCDSAWDSAKTSCAMEFSYVRLFIEGKMTARVMCAYF